MEETREVSAAEWNIMESLWEGAPKVGSRIVADMQDRKGWSRSTTLTMLRRMTNKGLIACEEGEEMRQYVPLLSRDTAVRKETESFLNRVYRGSLSLMVNAFVEKQRLSGQEIEDLKRILQKAEGERDE